MKSLDIIVGGKYNMKGSIAILFAVLLALSAGLVGAQSTSVPISIYNAEIDGTDIYPYGWNQLNIERNQEFTLKLELFAWEDADNVEIRASIDGYEFSNVEKIESEVGPFDFNENITYIKKLKLRLPEDVELDSYKLHVDIRDRNRYGFSQEYNLQIDAPRHAMKIADVTLNPGSSVKAGQTLLSRVRLENKGQKDEKDVKVTLSIPALGLSTSQYVEEVENGDEEEETEEFFLRLPKCAQPGTYDVHVEARYNKGNDKVSTKTSITVLENEACKEPAPVIVVQPPAQTAEPAEPKNSALRTGLEVILLVLVALLVVVGLVIGFSRMREE